MHTQKCYASIRLSLTASALPPWPTGKAQAFNDLFELDTSNPEQYKWREIVCSTAPPARSRHAAIAVRGLGMQQLELNWFQYTTGCHAS